MANHSENRQSPEKGNLAKLEQLKRTLHRLRERVLRQGFYGVAGIELKIQDGVIQRITSRMEEDEARTNMPARPEERQPPGDDDLAKLEQLKRTLDRLLDRALRRGFFGSAAIKLTIEDGTVQQITSNIEESQR